MGRSPLPIETWGKIRRLKTNSGTPAAVAYYRDLDGKRRRILRTGDTPAKAEENLKVALRDRLAPASDYLTPLSTLTELAAKWAEDLDRSTKSPSTIRRYKSVINSHLNEHVGAIRINEATVPRLQRFIDLSAEGSAAQARILGLVLSSMLELAVRHGAAKSNPAKHLLLPPQEQKEVRAPNDAEIDLVLERLRAFDAVKTSRDESLRDLTEFARMMLATGARIGEVLALQWDDLNTDAWTVTIQSTLVNVPGKGLTRRAPKTKSSVRTLPLPPFIRPMLTRRAKSAHVDWVFPSATGKPRWPESLRNQWREALKGSEVAWVGPHDLRKAVATALGSEAAKEQLGHATITVTDKHYVEKSTLRPDQTLVLEQRFGSEQSSQR